MRKIALRRAPGTSSSVFGRWPLAVGRWPERPCPVSARTKRAGHFVGLASLVLTFVIICAPGAWAADPRGGTISWTHVGNSGNTVQFTLQYSQRWTYPNAPGVCGGWACPPVGTSNTLAVFVLDGSAIFDFGDGNLANPTGTVTAVNPAEDWYTVTFVFQHTYPAPGPYTAYLFDTKRISTLEIGENQPEFLSTVVTANYVNG